MQDPKTIIVTGGAGFIGSHLCERLTNFGHKVISVDNYFTGSTENHVQGIEYREAHTKNIENVVSEDVDIIYHLGEYSRVNASIDEPALVWDLNIIGTLGILEFCRKKNIKLVYAGSSTKLADPRYDGISGPELAPYTWSKAANSDLVANYGHWYGVPYAIAYFYNVYGPRERAGKYGSVVEIFKQNYLNNEELKVNAPGTQTRIYTHVEDTVEGLILVGEKGQGDGYGIGSQDHISTLALAKLFSENIKMMPERKTSRPSAHVNTDKISMLGWEQKRTLREYILKFKKENPRP